MNVIQRFKELAKWLSGEVPTFVLVKRGLKVGENFNRQQGSYIDPTHCFLIRIGNDVTMSIRVTLMAHDASTKKILGYTKIGEIVIGDHVFIGANSTILPDVHIGNNCVIGAGSLVTKDVPDNSVVAGNPARVICSLDEFCEKNRELLEHREKFGKEYRYSKNMSEEKKKEIQEAARNGTAFID